MSEDLLCFLHLWELSIGTSRLQLMAWVFTSGLDEHEFELAMVGKYWVIENLNFLLLCMSSDSICALCLLVNAVLGLGLWLWTWLSNSWISWPWLSCWTWLALLACLAWCPCAASGSRINLGILFDPHSAFEFNRLLLSSNSISIASLICLSKLDLNALTTSNWKFGFSFWWSFFQCLTIA